ncbi:MAG: hypothetical protein ACRBBU_05685 [Pseudooceanicola sp.]
MYRRTYVALAALLLFGGCAGVPTGFGLSFKEQYSVARAALDEGRYKVAVKKYQALVVSDTGVRLNGRLSLELAHALLRNGDYEAAASTARRVAVSEGGAGRSLALAVQGTAEHEIARGMMDKGLYGPKARAHLVSSIKAMDEMLKKHPKLDQGEAMKRRRVIAKRELATFR